MAPRKNKEPASWEVDADKPKPDGETRVRRAYCVKDLVTRKSWKEHAHVCFTDIFQQSLLPELTLFTTS